MAGPGAGAPRDRPALPVRLARYGLRELAPVRAWARREVQDLREPRGATFAPGHHARDLRRQWQRSACYAPLTSMYLDQFGKVRACCQNTGHLLGDVGTSTLREIWDGTATREIRDALGRGDLSLGCEFCAWQEAEVEPAAWFLRMFDHHPAGWSDRPAWPRQLEFAVSNTCNLQCVMCNGDWSSSIRAQREHRPALPSAYPERFYEELQEFIPHLHEAKFTGGEPFLGTEPQRIMELLAAHATRRLTVNITTNGTVFTPRVERMLSSLRPWITVSLDGGTAESYERVRVGASFAQVMANMDRFAEITADRGTGMNLVHCLMVDNWETFPELLALAEERQLDVFINTVRFPERHSLHHLPPAQLQELAVALERRTPEVEATVTGNRLDVWREQLAFLRARASATNWPEALGVPPEDRAEVAVALGPTRRDPS